jgi:hypothetical protein
MQRQKSMRDALKTQDAEEVQRLAFQHEVSDEMLDSFIEMHGRNRGIRGQQGASKLFRDIEGAGLASDDKRWRSAYGGDLGEAGDPFRNEDGTYDLKKMKSKNKDLYNQAIQNRSRELVRTYLKQGGKDAYAMHEGLRSIGDMDLEHITSLTAGGADGPENWVFSSGQLNKLRQNQPLDKAVEKYAEGGLTDVRKTNAARKQTWNDFTSQFSKEQIDDIEKDLGGGDFKKLFTKGGYQKLSQEEINDKRSRARRMGMSDDQINTLFPDMRDPGEVYADKKSAYLAGPEQYQQAVTDDERMRIREKDLVAQLKKKYPGMGENEILNTPEGRQGRDEIYGLSSPDEL